MTTKVKKLPPNLVVEEVKQAVLRELRQIPGVGKSIAQDLWNLGLRSVSDLKNQDPEDLYLRLCALQGTHVDRCMLYVFRCAVYYASNDIHDPEQLKWWNWKDNPECGVFRNQDIFRTEQVQSLDDVGRRAKKLPKSSMARK